MVLSACSSSEQRVTELGRLWRRVLAVTGADAAALSAPLDTPLLVEGAPSPSACLPSDAQRSGLTTSPPAHAACQEHLGHAAKLVYMLTRALTAGKQWREAELALAVLRTIYPLLPAPTLAPHVTSLLTFCRETVVVAPAMARMLSQALMGTGLVRKRRATTAAVAWSGSLVCSPPPTRGFVFGARRRAMGCSTESRLHTACA